MSTTNSIHNRYRRWAFISDAYSLFSVVLLLLSLLKAICPGPYCSNPLPPTIGWSIFFLVIGGHIICTRKERASYRDYIAMCHEADLAKHRSRMESRLDVFKIPRKLDPEVVFSLGENWQRSPLKEVTLAKFPFVDNNIPVVFVLQEDTSIHIDADSWKSDRRVRQCPMWEGWEWLSKETGLDIQMEGDRNRFCALYRRADGKFDPRPDEIWGHWLLPLEQLEEAIKLANLLAGIHGNDKFNQYFQERALLSN